MAYSHEEIKQLETFAYEYIEECWNHTRPHVAGSGKVVNVPDRHIPTIDFFLRIWLPKTKGMSFIARTTWYDWLNSDDSLKSNTIKRINEVFNALARDIVANEGKGIFYAKNKLGMHDKQHIEQRNVDKFDFDGND
jgi:hypothetical protein